MWVLVLRDILASRQTMVVVDCRGDSGVMMVMTPTVMVSIGACRRRAAGVDMHGRVMEQQTGLFTAIRVALLGGHLA